MNHRRRTVAAIAWFLFAGTPAAVAQQTCQARMEQDPSLNNLVHPAGYRAAEPGALGRVVRAGSGPLHLVLVAGAGFGGEIFASFIETNRERYTMTAVTLPGFGGTAAPPMPPPGTSYAEQSWTRAAQDAVARLIEEQGLDRPVIVGHWLSGTQVALGLAVERPDLVRAAIVVSGVSRFVGATGAPEPATAQQRAILVDQHLAPNWFKTVTRATWDDNNFLPRDYAIHPLRAQQLWVEAGQPSLPTWIRYLCEVWAGDSRAELARVEIPTLVVMPEFDALYREGPQMGDYMAALLHRGWEGGAAPSDRVTVQSIADSRTSIMDDQPAKLGEAVARFVDQVGAGTPHARPDPAARPAASAAAPARDFWRGSIQHRGTRHVLADAGVSLELPPGWTLQAEADKAPVVARIADAEKTAQSVLQVQADFGMALEALVAAAEAQYAQLPKFEKVSAGPATLGGRAARQLNFTSEREGRLERSRLIVVSLADDFVLFLSFRATPAEFTGFEPAFDLIAASIEFEPV